jgi:molybdopterin molybdotransferase
MERIELEKALELALSKVKPIQDTLALPLAQTLGRVAGEAVYAPLDNPPFDRSPLDGFALQSEDTRSASSDSPVRLRIRGEVPAGIPLGCGLKSGETVRIMTGAMIPGDCDCVIAKEQVREEGSSILIFESLEHHQNYVFQGEDIRSGQLLVSAGERLRFIHLGILAAMGLEKVKIFRSPEIGLLCTGDELTLPGQPLFSGRIYESNSILLSCYMREMGFTPVTLPVMTDNILAVAEEITARMDRLDILVSTGGVGTGDRDIFHEVFKLLGAERLFWRMNFKPGGTVLCGLYRGKLLMCLSGNPFACFTAFELLVIPVLATLSGREDLKPRWARVILKNSFPKKSGQRRFVRARVEEGKASLPEKHASGQLFSLLGCNCLLDIPPGTGELDEGSEVEAIFFHLY